MPDRNVNGIVEGVNFWSDSWDLVEKGGWI